MKIVHVSLQAAPQDWTVLGLFLAFKSEPSRLQNQMKESLKHSRYNCQELTFIAEFQMQYPSMHCRQPKEKHSVPPLPLQQ